MDVEVVDTLGALLAVVDDNPEAVRGDSLSLGHLLGDEEEVAEECLVLLWVGLGELGNGFPGDDQDVNWRLRVDVVEGDTVVILVNDLGGDLLPEDLAKNGVSSSRRRIQPNLQVAGFLGFQDEWRAMQGPRKRETVCEETTTVGSPGKSHPGGVEGGHEGKNGEKEEEEVEVAWISRHFFDFLPFFFFLFLFFFFFFFSFFYFFIEELLGVQGCC